MKKINKEIIHSIQFTEWHGKLDNKSHPKYTSSKHKYYYDIVLELFRSQNGLCAYTEVFLCPEENYQKSSWNDNGKVKSEVISKEYELCPQNGKINFEYSGQLDHFDPELKELKGWSWSNFFMCDSDVNHEKSDKAVDYILKPDSPEYDEFKLLEYNPRLHRFIANLELTEDLQIRVNKMIEVLQLNFEPIRKKREEKLNTRKDLVNFGLKSWKDDITEFPTAFKMMETMHQLGLL